jgi:hypothetical protein
MPYIIGPDPILTRSRRHSAGSALAPPSPYPLTVDPSPVESTGSSSTDATDIDVDGAQDVDEVKSPDIELISPASHEAILTVKNSIKF